MNEEIVSSTPELISEERKKYLLEKWGAVLNAPVLTDEEYQKKLENTVILEAQESYFCAKDNKWKVKI